MKKTTIILFTVLIMLAGCFDPPIPNEINEWEYVGLAEDHISSINAMVFHPSDPDIIYVCTNYHFSFGLDGYLLKSQDAGETWDTIKSSFGNGSNYNDLVFHPMKDSTLFIVNGRGLYESNNGGISWNSIFDSIYLDWETYLNCFMIDPVDTNIMYVGTTGFFGGNLYKSTDSGVNWRRIESDIIGDVRGLFIHPNNHNKIFSISNPSGDILVSTNTGESWSFTGLNNTLVYINDILFDRLNSDIMYATVEYNNRTLAGIDLRWGVMKSIDGGKLWMSENEGLPDSITFTPIDILQDQDNGELYLNVYANDSLYVYHSFADTLFWEKIRSAPRDESGFGHLKFSPNGDYLYFYNHGIYKMALQ